VADGKELILVEQWGPTTCSTSCGNTRALLSRSFKELSSGGHLVLNCDAWTEVTDLDLTRCGPLDADVI
jgi:hypothetical protein